MEQEYHQGQHRMGRRSQINNYHHSGTYHITIRTNALFRQPLGQIIGDINKPDGDPDAPHTALLPIGKMVEEELLTSITAHYPMVEVLEHVIMPEHLHFILVVWKPLVSENGRDTHLGQVIAGFKKGCNRRFWDIAGMAAPVAIEGRGEPTLATAALEKRGEPALATAPPPAASSVPWSRPAVPPQGGSLPSKATTGRPPLFEYGYVDVMPLDEGQLQQQREYIRNNPRNRLLRMQTALMRPQRGGIDTALTPSALKGYLKRECHPSQFDEAIWQELQARLLIANGYIDCDTYGDRGLLSARLLPVVCHRSDAPLFPRQKARCLAACREGAVLVSARIAKGEQDIIRSVADDGFPVITIDDNGFPAVYHPSDRRLSLCAASRLLIVTPWQYHYRRADDHITVAYCKAMNCLVQALCRQKDDWWKQ
jgi:hypothetical protein